MEKKINIFWTDKAKNDLRQIFDYYSDEVTEEKAQTIVLSILNRTKQLEANPYSGAIEPLLLQLKFKYRRLIVDNYKIIYRTTPSKIFINSIFDSRQNPQNFKVK